MVGKASTPAFLERPPQVLPNVSWVHPAAAGVQSALMEGDAATAQSLLKELLTCAKGMPAPWGVDAAAHAWVPSRGTPGFSGVREPLNARPLPPAQTCETHRATHLYTPDEKERAQLLMVMIDAERKRRVRSPSRHQRCASEWGGVRFGKRAPPTFPAAGAAAGSSPIAGSSRKVLSRREGRLSLLASWMATCLRSTRSVGSGG